MPTFNSTSSKTSELQPTSEVMERKGSPHQELVDRRRLKLFEYAEQTVSRKSSTLRMHLHLASTDLLQILLSLYEIEADFRETFPDALARLEFIDRVAGKAIGLGKQIAHFAELELRLRRRDNVPSKPKSSNEIVAMRKKTSAPR